MESSEPRVEYVYDSEFDYERSDTIWVHLPDGRVLEVRGSSYEDVDLDWGFLGADEVRARRRENARLAMGHRERARVGRLTRSVYEAEKAKKVAEAKASMTEAEFKRWYEETYGLTAVDRILKEAYAEPIMQAMARESLLLQWDQAAALKRQTYRATVPLKKETP